MKVFAIAVCCLVASVSMLALAADPTGKSYKIFDGKSLTGWKIADFGGQDEVTVEKGALRIPVGQDMAGVTWDVENPPHGLLLPQEDYELSLEAMRVDGSDFFCGVTFPVGDEPCSLILGGWGGGVVGLSSINGNDASENETTQFIPFDNKKWYKVRLRVTKTHVTAWLDNKEIIDVEREGKKFSIRSEVELNRPLGFSTWQTIGSLRNIKLTVFQAAEEDEASPSDRPLDTPSVESDAAPEPDAATPAGSSGSPACDSLPARESGVGSGCVTNCAPAPCCRQRVVWRRGARRCR